MLSWIAAHFSTGKGELIDLGCFLGGSTAHLLYGITLAGGTYPVHAYDQFLIDESSKPFWLYDRGFDRFAGEDMLPIFENITSPFGTTITQKGQMSDLKWTGNPIELLFVDICKDLQTTIHVMKEFYPHLIPNQSIVIQQDYQHWMHPWVVATTEALSDYLELVSWTFDNSVIFMCRKQITQDVIEKTTEDTNSYMKVRSLIEKASQKFPQARQQEAVWQSIIALDRNPSATSAYELSLA